MKDNQHFKSYKKIRQTWEINPKERVVASKKEYDRNAVKQEIKETIDEELTEDYTFDVDWYNDPIALDVE